MSVWSKLDGAKLYFDSNVFIYALESPDNARRSRHAQLFELLGAKRLTALTSVLTRAEVLVRPLRMRQTALAATPWR